MSACLKVKKKNNNRIITLMQVCIHRIRLNISQRFPWKTQSYLKSHIRGSPEKPYCCRIEASIRTYRLKVVECTILEGTHYYMVVRGLYTLAVLSNRVWPLLLTGLLLRAISYILEGAGCTGTQTGSQQKLSPFQKWLKMDSS